MKIRSKQRIQLWRIKNRSKIKLWRHKRYLLHKEEELKQATDWQKRNPEKVRETVRKSSKKFRMKHGNPYLKKWIKDNPEKRKAHQIVSHAIRDGILLKGLCRDCSSDKVHAHHQDYTEPLKVIWLCPLHHKAEHAKINKTKSI